MANGSLRMLLAVAAVLSLVAATAATAEPTDAERDAIFQPVREQWTNCIARALVDLERTGTEAPETMAEMVLAGCLAEKNAMYGTLISPEVAIAPWQAQRFVYELEHDVREHLIGHIVKYRAAHPAP